MSKSQTREILARARLVLDDAQQLDKCGRLVGEQRVDALLVTEQARIFIGMLRIGVAEAAYYSLLELNELSVRYLRRYCATEPTLNGR